MEMDHTPEPNNIDVSLELRTNVMSEVKIKLPCQSKIISDVWRARFLDTA